MDRITSSPPRGGAPTIRDTNITVATVVTRVAAGDSWDAIVERFAPFLEREDIPAALVFAARQVAVASP